VENTSPEKGRKSSKKSETKTKAKNSAKSPSKPKTRTGVKNSNGTKDRAGTSSKDKSTAAPKSPDVSYFLKNGGNPVLRKKSRPDETNNQAKRRRTEKEHKTEPSAKTAK